MTAERTGRTRLLAICPQFRVPDVAATAAHYRDVLGFEVQAIIGDPPELLEVRRDGVVLQLGLAQTGAAGSNRELSWTGCDAHIWVEDVDALVAELRGRGANIVEGPEDRPYGRRELVVRDLNGMALCFSEQRPA